LRSVLEFSTSLKDRRHIDHILLLPGSPVQVPITHSLDATLAPLVGLGGTNLVEIKRKAYIISDAGQPVPDKWKTFVEEGEAAGKGLLSLRNETGEAALEVLKTIIAIPSSAG
jgi:hypothetical protein